MKWILDYKWTSAMSRLFYSRMFRLLVVAFCICSLNEGCPRTQCSHGLGPFCESYLVFQKTMRAEAVNLYCSLANQFSWATKTSSRFGSSCLLICLVDVIVYSVCLCDGGKFRTTSNRRCFWWMPLWFASRRFVSWCFYATREIYHLVCRARSLHQAPSTQLRSYQ